MAVLENSGGKCMLAQHRKHARPLIGLTVSMKFAFLTTAALFILIASLATEATAKVWTIDDRQSQLMKDINEGQKGKQLTKKEADHLRSDLADVARKKKKMKNKADNGKLTEDDKKELEGDLNKISDAIHKYKLEKRAQ
ncbi:MAG TPA: hypothetical protein PKZ32_15915 [Candidatus Melainabacteria bacterium]|nr:hypothetical protein [Candidatus Melainabacteria bacterium]